MRIKNLLGLLAIGGAVAYAQKRRGGEMSLAGIKQSFNELVSNVKTKVGDLANQVGAMGNQQNRSIDPVSSQAGSTGFDDYGSSGFTSGTVGSNGSTRRY